MDIEILLPCHCLVQFLGSCLVFLIAGCLVGIHCLPPYWKISYVAIRLRTLLSENRWPNELHSHLPSVALSVTDPDEKASFSCNHLAQNSPTHFLSNKSYAQQLVFTAQFFRNLQQNLISNTVEPSLASRPFFADTCLIYGHVAITDSFLYAHGEPLNFS